MSVNVVGEDFGLHQLAGNVSPEVVAQIQQLAAQAAQYAKLADESARAAQELAGSANDAANKALEASKNTEETVKKQGKSLLRYYTDRNKEWGRIFDTTSVQSFSAIVTVSLYSSVPQTQSFLISGLQNNGVAEGKIIQLNSLDKSQIISKVRLTWDNGFHIDLFFSTINVYGFTVSIDNITITSPNAQFSMPEEFEEVNEVGDIVKEHIPVYNVGIIADRALADGAGNNIINTYLPVSSYIVVNPTAAEAVKLKHGGWMVFTEAPKFELSITRGLNIYAEVDITLPSLYNFGTLLLNNCNCFGGGQVNNCIILNMAKNLKIESELFNLRTRAIYGSLKLFLETLQGPYNYDNHSVAVSLNSYSAVLFNGTNATSKLIFTRRNESVVCSVLDGEGVYSVPYKAEEDLISVQSDTPPLRDNVPDFILDAIAVYESTYTESEESE